MTKALIYKEWLKTRRAFWVCVALALFFTGYSMLGINRVSTTHGVEHIWLIMLMKDQLFIDAVKYIPLMCGLLLGLAQMVPEMQQYRLKLTLHLPCPTLKLLGMMLLAGITELTVIYIVMAVCIVIYYSSIIAPEMTANVIASTVPWFLAGYTAYLFTAAVCLEGKWKHRIILALLAAAVTTVYFMQPVPGAYNGILLPAVVLTVMLSCLSYISVSRFRQGLID